MPVERFITKLKIRKFKFGKRLVIKKGFTLIEMLIVVVIVGTLMAVAVPKYHIALETGRPAKVLYT